jgi:hypothetical protein
MAKSMLEKQQNYILKKMVEPVNKWSLEKKFKHWDWEKGNPGEDFSKTDALLTQVVTRFPEKHHHSSLDIRVETLTYIYIINFFVFCFVILVNVRGDIYQHWKPLSWYLTSTYLLHCVEWVNLSPVPCVCLFKKIPLDIAYCLNLLEQASKRKNVSVLLQNCQLK